MAKNNLMYVCQNCGAGFKKWQGQCDGCGEWNSLAEQIAINTSEKGARARHNNTVGELKNADLSGYLVNFDHKLQRTEHVRLSTTLVEFDRVLGADERGVGMVAGSVVLIGGEPGIGKSTLLTQVVIGMGQG